MRNPIEGSSQIGTMYVYREYVARRNVIEYTIFFRRDGKKWRIDLEATEDEFSKLTAPGDMTRYMTWRIEKAVRNGQYVDAAKAIQ